VFHSGEENNFTTLSVTFNSSKVSGFDGGAKGAVGARGAKGGRGSNVSAEGRRGIMGKGGAGRSASANTGGLGGCGTVSLAGLTQAKPKAPAIKSAIALNLWRIFNVVVFIMVILLIR